LGKKSFTDQLKKFRQNQEEAYAKVIMEDPIKTTLRNAIPKVGVVLIMGDMGAGKSALAHAIAEMRHKASKVKPTPAVFHLPMVDEIMRKQIQRQLPKWIKVTTKTKDWPNHSTVIYDEASQSAHARRTQSGDAVELDNLMGISRQREQLVVFISHHSRKLDPNVLRDMSLIIWKRPTYAHWLFERSEITDFVLKAIQFFKKIHGAKTAQRSCMSINFKELRCEQFTNSLPSYWTERLSKLFEQIKQK
jgi:hypothetical protein